MAETVFLDACVLFPRLLRGILLNAAERDLFRPAWSARVIREWRMAAARDGGIAAEARVDATVAEMRRAFPEGEVKPSDVVEREFHLPDPADAHVAAGAVAAGALTILTLNIRDFPARRLSVRGLAARHPDGFLWELLSTYPETTAGAVRAAFASLDANGPRAERNALKRAGLGRLGKAWEAARA